MTDGEFRVMTHTNADLGMEALVSESFRDLLGSIMMSEPWRASSDGGPEPQNESGETEPKNEFEETETRSQGNGVEQEPPGEVAFGSEPDGGGDSGLVSEDNIVERDINAELATEDPASESIRVDGDLLGSIIMSEPWNASSDGGPEPMNECEETEPQNESEETEPKIEFEGTESSQGNGVQWELPGEVAFESEPDGSGDSGPVSRDNTVERDTNAELVTEAPVSESIRVYGDGDLPGSIIMSEPGRASSDEGPEPMNESEETEPTNGSEETELKMESEETEPKNESEETETRNRGNGVQQEAPGGVAFGSEPDGSAPASQGNTVERNTNAELAAEGPVSDSIAVKEARAANGVSASPADKEPMSKKRKAAKDDSAKPKKRQPEPQQQQGSKKPKKGYVFPYGNYHRYYGYRLTKSVDEDPRLKFFQREWFEGKDCLDVGCNEGFVTISIAQKYKCRTMVGVDLDNFLIEKATRNLEAAAESNALEDGPPPEQGRLAETVVVRTCDNSGERCDERVENHSAPDWGGDERPCPGSESLLQRVKFRQEQFIENFPRGNYMKDGTFDTVLCLSVTKWVHLNWGDTGLIRLFAKIFHILRPGGILVLEPQPWRSYEKKYYVSEVTRRCYETIQLRPTHFRQVLLDKIGFRSVEEVSQAVPNSSVGFDRSLFLYFK